MHIFLLRLVAVLSSTSILMQCRVLYTFASSSAFSISVLSLRRRRLVSHGSTLFHTLQIFCLPSSRMHMHIRSSPPPSHVCTNSSSRSPSFGDEDCPYVPLAHRYVLVVVFNEYAFYELVRSTTTAATTTTAV